MLQHFYRNPKFILIIHTYLLMLIPCFSSGQETINGGSNRPQTGIAFYDDSHTILKGEEVSDDYLYPIIANNMRHLKVNNCRTSFVNPNTQNETFSQGFQSEVISCLELPGSTQQDLKSLSAFYSEYSLAKTEEAYNSFCSLENREYLNSLDLETINQLYEENNVQANLQVINEFRKEAERTIGARNFQYILEWATVRFKPNLEIRKIDFSEYANSLGLNSEELVTTICYRPSKINED